MERSRKKIDALMMAFTAYMADRKPKPLSSETRYNYRGRVMRAMAKANEAGRSLLADDLQTLRFVLGSFPPHPSTQTGYIAALMCFYDFLIQQGLRKDNPAKLIGRPPKLKGLPRPLPKDRCGLYEKAAIRLGRFYEAIAVLGLYQGWRRTEIRHAQWSWFFEADGQMWIDVTGKGGFTDRVAAHPRTVELLMHLRLEHNDPKWLFPSPMNIGQPIGGTWMSRAHKLICAEAGIPEDTRLHQLRHSYATYLRQSGADGPLVQQGMRHRDPKSTAGYMAVFPIELAAAHRRLRYIDPEPEPEPVGEDTEKGDSDASSS